MIVDAVNRLLSEWSAARAALAEIERDDAYMGA